MPLQYGGGWTKIPNDFFEGFIESPRWWFHPYLDKIKMLTNIFRKGLKPPTSLRLVQDFFKCMIMSV